MSRITVKFEGSFFNGSIFDSSESITLLLPQLILGWRIGVPLIKEGGSMTLYIPASFAWGEFGNSDGTIGPGTNVIFVIDLLEVL